MSNEFRPSAWITDVIPRKSPFVPQMGDEVRAIHRLLLLLFLFTVYITKRKKKPLTLFSKSLTVTHDLLYLEIWILCVWHTGQD